MREVYEVRLKYFDSKDGYWKHSTEIVRGLKNKSSHRQAGIDACRLKMQQGFTDVSVVRVDYC